MGYFVSQRLPQQPEGGSSPGSQLRQIVADIYPAIADAHPKNVFAWEVREEDVITGDPLPIFAHGDNLRRLASHQQFDRIIRHGAYPSLRARR
jgi:hypothetical protein